MKEIVTSLPVSSNTLALLARTSWPSPPTISALALGVESPPSCSGHTGTSGVLFKDSSTCSSFSEVPSYLQSRPARQPLISIIGKVQITRPKCHNPPQSPFSKGRFRGILGFDIDL